MEEGDVGCRRQLEDFFLNAAIMEFRVAVSFDVRLALQRHLGPSAGSALQHVKPRSLQKHEFDERLLPGAGRSRAKTARLLSGLLSGDSPRIREASLPWRLAHTLTRFQPQRRGKSRLIPRVQTQISVSDTETRS